MFEKSIANRGEIALRIVRALQDMGIASVAVHADDDAQAPHVQAADAAVALGATGPAAYLDGARLLAIARQQGADAIHPGYGFLSERADFARLRGGRRALHRPHARAAGLFGDKAQARALAQRLGVPLLPGSAGAVTLDEAQAFLAAQGGAGVMLKAVGGGGGRGMRAVRTAGELAAAYERCRSEARGLRRGRRVRRAPDGRRAPHRGAGAGRRHDAMALGERECTLQRRFQKLVEIAPSPGLPEALRQRWSTPRCDGARGALPGPGHLRVPGRCRLHRPALRLHRGQPAPAGGAHRHRGGVRRRPGAGADPAGGGRAPARHRPGPAAPPRPRAAPSSGASTPRRWTRKARHARQRPLARFDVPAGPGIRVDTHGVAGRAPSPHYDTLLAKLVVHARGGWADALRRSRRALAEFRIEGLPTNLPLLRRWPRGPRWPASSCTRAGWRRRCPSCWMLPNQ
jgi:acetyl/propionyl-CoA carboxylase alpha subunit